MMAHQIELILQPELFSVIDTLYQEETTTKCLKMPTSN